MDQENGDTRFDDGRCALTEYFQAMWSYDSSDHQVDGADGDFKKTTITDYEKNIMRVIGTKVKSLFVRHRNYGNYAKGADGKYHLAKDSNQT